MVAVAIPSLVLSLLGLTIAYRRLLPSSPLGAYLWASLGCAIAGATPWLVLAPWILPAHSAVLLWPVAALGAVAGVVVSVAVRPNGAGGLTSVILTAVWSTLVFVPAATLAFGAQFMGLGAFAPIDHGGVLPVHVGTGAAVAVVLLVRGNGAIAARSAAPFMVVATVVFALGWMTWLAAAEFAFDEATATIALNGLIAAVGGLAGWLGVQRILHAPASFRAAAAGVVSGLVGVGAGAPLFTPVSATATGVVAGAAACWVTLSRMLATGEARWVVVGCHFAAGAVGMLALGLFGNDVGYIFTGQTELLLAQIGSTAAFAAWSGVAGLGMAWLTTRATRAASLPTAARQR